MRIGPVQITREPARLRAGKPDTSERGYSGGPSWGGERQYGEEIDVNTLWRPPTRWATVRKMRAHPDCNAAIDAIVLALLSTPLEIVPASDDELDVEIAAFIQNDLDNMSTSLYDHRAEALDGALWDGVAPYQTVFAFDQATKRYHLRKLAIRPPSTVQTWHADEHGGPDGITQLDQDGRPVRFTMDELLVFVHRRKGGDLAGNPLSRRMYGPWLILDRLAKIGAAAVERHGLGVPVMKGTTGTDAENTRIESLLSGLRAAAKAYVRLSADQDMGDFDIKGLSGTVVDPVPQMEYHRRSIYLSTFTQGQVLGSDGVGSLALGETHADLLMMMLSGISQMETDTYNRYLLPRWVGYNWSVPEGRLPKAVLSKPDRRDVAGWFTAVLQATEAGVQLDKPALRTRAHDLLGVPLPDPDAARDRQDSGDEGESEGESDKPARQFAGVDLAKRKRLESEVALDALGIAVDFAKMAKSLDGSEAAIAKAAKAVQTKQRRNLFNRAKEIVAKGDPTLVAETEVRFTDELAAAIEVELLALHELGAGEVERELRQQGAAPVKPGADDKATDREMIAALALTTAALLADRLKRAWASETLAQLRDGKFNGGRLDEITGGLSDKAIADHARQDSSVGLGLGRALASRINRGKIDRYINSEVMDANTCAECLKVDGKVIDAGEIDQYAPYRNCLGRDRCRGVVVAVVK